MITTTGNLGRSATTAGYLLAMTLTLWQGSPVAFGREPSTEQTRSPLANTKQSVLSRLEQISNDDESVWLVGQNAGTGNSSILADYQRHVTRLRTTTGESPSLLGVDLGFNDIPLRQPSTERLVREFWQQGGLVTFSMHPPSPFRNSDCHDVRAVDWDEIFVPGSIVQKRWQRTLDRVVDLLLPLQADGVVVLWRPLHEMNGGWFWWCARHPDDSWTSQEQFVELWKDMHDYFASRGVYNLLWVYAPAVQTNSEQRSAMHYYPGDDYVDVVGLDWYDDELKDLDAFGSYQQLSQLGKPMGLTEFGPLSQRDGKFDNLKLLAAMRRYPRLGFALFWHSWSGADVAIVDNRNAKELMTSKDAVTLDLFRQLAE